MHLHQLTFLVVDDMELMRAVTVNQLRAMGCEKVLSARNGAEALRVLHARKIDVVLADWNMPIMSGLDLLRVVRAEPKFAGLPFLMITAEAERHRIEEVIRAGVSSLLVKPYSASILKARLLRLLGDLAEPAGAGRRLRVPEPPPAARLQPVEPTAAKAALAPTRILMVDDAPASLRRLTRLFDDDYLVQTALEGADALAQLRAGPLPDLVMMDVMMPGLDGFETVRRMREDPAMAQIPVIFVTGQADDETRLKGMELGAVDFVDSDADPRMLRTRVRNFIRFVDMRRRLQLDYDAMLEAARRHKDAEAITRHDLRGALSGILGMVRTLADDASLAPRHAQQLRMVAQAAQQVMNLVNLGSELYSIEAGRFKLKPEPVPLGGLLRDIVELARSSFADKHLTLVVDTDTPVGTETPSARGDALLCYSMFQNLVKNACEAAPPGSRVAVMLKDENPLRVLIHNTGAVPPEVREHFFEKFSTSGKTGGSGLGTYSARLLALAQHGTLDMSTSDADNSTTLAVTLPRHTFQSEPPIER